MNILLWVLFLIFIALNIADFVSTKKALDLGFREANPAMEWLMDKMGVVLAMIIAKSLVIVILAGVLAFTPQWLNAGMLVIINILYCVVVYNNFRGIYDYAPPLNKFFK